MKRFGIALLVLGCNLTLPALAQSDTDRVRQELRKFFPLGASQSAQASFQFDGFKLNRESGETAAWQANLTTSQAIAGNTYTVKSAFLSKAGAVLFSGEDIALPASRAGKAITLTRNFRLQPGIASLRLDVFDRALNQVIHSQSHDLEAEALALLQGRQTDRLASPAALPAQTPPQISQSGELKYALRLQPDAKAFDIHNDSSFPLRIEEAIAHYRFPGLDGRDRASCSRTQLQPGQTASCTLEASRMACSSLMAIDVELKLNGQRVRERLDFEPMLRAIRTRPQIELSKPMYKGFGDVRVFFTGQYIRPGTEVIVKALASVDSHRFPVTFRATQQETYIQGMESPVGPTVNVKVDKFCFHLLEVTSDDSMSCGGVGHLLYREWNQGTIPTESQSGNLFLHNMLCK